MKLRIEAEIDCTPEELKEFWSAPHLNPIQHAFATALEKQMSQQLATSPVAAWMKLWGITGALESRAGTSNREQ